MSGVRDALAEVLTAVRAVADADGIAHRWQVIEATPDVPDTTRNLILLGLVDAGWLHRIAPGVYRLPT